MSEPKEESHFFYEDEVFRVNRNGVIQFGLVTKDSESATSEYEDDESEKLAAGTMRVAWHPNGKSFVVGHKSVGLADRSLMPGDVVRRLIAGEDTQRGYCRDVSVRATVEVVGTQRVIYGVESSHLVPVEHFMTDVAVCLDSWVGMIRSISTTVELKLADGSICRLSDKSAETLTDVNDHRSDECHFKRYDFYVGQVLTGPARVFLDDGNFVHMSDELRNVKNSLKRGAVLCGTVASATVDSLGVDWKCRAYDVGAGEQTAAGQPGATVAGDSLERVKMLNVFEPSTLQIGDRNTYVLKPDDIIMARWEWKKLEKSIYLPSDQGGGEPEAARKVEAAATKRPPATKAAVPSSKLSRRKGLRRAGGKCSSCSSGGRGLKPRENLAAKFPEFKPGDKVVVETVCTKSEVTVVWQDGTVEAGIPSSELFPIHALDEQEYFPGDFVAKNPSGSDEEADSARRYGVVQRVDHNGRTCLVTWFLTYLPGADPKPLEAETTEEPVYDLRDHPDFRFRPGTIVIRVANFPGNEDCVASGGQVLDNCTTGQVKVCWADNSTSNCWPQDLYKVGDYDSDDGELWEDDDDDDFDDSDVGDDNAAGGSDASWETESEHSISQEASPEKPEENAGFLRTTFAASVERARMSLTKLEDIFVNKPSFSTRSVVRQLLVVFRNCKKLDTLMGTRFFDESNFGEIFGDNADESDSVSVRIAKFFRLASAQDAEVADETKKCALLCSLIKSQLVKSHDEVMERYGGQEAVFAGEDLGGEMSGGEEIDDKDLDELVEKVAREIPTESDKSAFEFYSGQAAEKIASVDEVKAGDFDMLESAPAGHKYKLSVFQPSDAKSFAKFVRKEVELLRSNLPEGIHVRGYEDRMDLYSVMIRGPAKTPYEDGLFFFDFQLSADYPKSPPAFHYHSHVRDRLNPNLYEDGKVCVSLLGTWAGRGSETWSPAASNLLQVLVSIQGLILVAEPYFNEAGYERQRGSQQGAENSRMYNEMVVIRLVDGLAALAGRPPPPAFARHVGRHLRTAGPRLIQRLESWKDMSDVAAADSPKFPLLPASRGFRLSLEKSLTALKKSLTTSGFMS